MSIGAVGWIEMGDEGDECIDTYVGWILTSGLGNVSGEGDADLVEFPFATDGTQYFVSGTLDPNACVDTTTFALRISSTFPATTLAAMAAVIDGLGPTNTGTVQWNAQISSGFRLLSFSASVLYAVTPEGNFWDWSVDVFDSVDGTLCSSSGTGGMPSATGCGGLYVSNFPDGSISFTADFNAVTETGTGITVEDVILGGGVFSGTLTSGEVAALI